MTNPAAPDAPDLEAIRAERITTAAVAILTNAGFSIEGVAAKKERHDPTWYRAVKDAEAVLRYADALPSSALLQRDRERIARLEQQITLAETRAYTDVHQQGMRIYNDERNGIADRRAIRAFVGRFEHHVLAHPRREGRVR